MMTEPIRILHVLGGISLGGAESRIMDLYRYIDRDKIQFDFLIHQTEKGYYEEEIETLGGRIYRVPRFRLYNIAAYKKALRAFFASHHEFKAVHGHMTSTAAIYLPIAKKYGVPMTIAHARSAGVDKGIKGVATRLLRMPLKKRCDYMFACSMLAAESVFGTGNAHAGRVKIVPNAIDVKQFTYQEEMRIRMRRALSLEDKFVVGHVGRFHYAKNHEYLLAVFQKIVLRKSNAVLLLLGEGSRMEEMKERAAALGIADKVIFCGNQKETWNYYQAMDFFVFPSRFEGLPGTVVEAQGAGLRCLISDTIANEVKITELVASLNIEEKPEKWAEYVLEHEMYERKDRYEQIAAAGFDVSGQAAWYEDFYQYGTCMKKILLIVPALHQGGMEKVCAATAKLLQPHFDVRIAIFDSRSIVYDTEGIPVDDLQLPPRSGKLGKVLNVLLRGWKLRRIKKKEHIDISYSFGPTANLANIASGCREVKWMGIRSYMDMGNPRQIRMFCRHADRVICCSEAICREIREKYQCDKAVTLSNPFDLAQVKILSEREEITLPWSEGRVIVSMGREDVVKGFWHLFKSFSLVHGKLPDTKLMIIGEGEFTVYRELASKLGIGGDVFFTGVKKNPYPYLKRTSLYVLTSYYEGFPNALVEAMALGVPAIATDCMTGPREILQDRYGILIPNMSPKEDYDPTHITAEERALAGEIISLLEDPEKMEHYSRMALERAGNYTTEAYVEKICGWAAEIL